MDRRDFMTSAGTAVAASLLAPDSMSRGQETKAGKGLIRVGQIGTKHAHAAGKIEAMRKFPETFEVVGIVEPDDARWDIVKDAPSYRGVRRMSEEELLGTKGLQAVAVETEVRDLAATAMRCVLAGMHIHLDKPAGASMPACRALHAAAAESKRVIQMGYMLRHNPAFQLCYRAFREGWLGDVFELHAVMSKTSGEEARREMAEFSGGSMFELGCHIIDSAVYILGKPEKVTPYIRRTRAERGDGLADNCLAVLEYPGATATIKSALMEYEGFERRQFTVCGNLGTVDIRPLEPPKMRLALSEPRADYLRGYQDIAFGKPEGRYDREFLDFAALIRGEKEPDFSSDHDLAVHETLLLSSGMSVD